MWTAYDCAQHDDDNDEFFKMIFENAGKVLMHYDETASILLAHAVENYFGIEDFDMEDIENAG